jgi:hypothetical protein
VVLDYVPSDGWRERREVRRTEREQTVDECEESRGIRRGIKVSEEEEADVTEAAREALKRDNVHGE